MQGERDIICKTNGGDSRTHVEHKTPKQPVLSPTITELWWIDRKSVPYENNPICEMSERPTSKCSTYSGRAGKIPSDEISSIRISEGNGELQALKHWRNAKSTWRQNLQPAFPQTSLYLQSVKCTKNMSSPRAVE